MANINNMEPMLIRDGCKKKDELLDLVTTLTRESTKLSSTLPDPISSSISELMRSMNSYYSNLIEGHNTHPIDIEQALGNDFSDEPKQQNLQIEAKAHIETQRWIDKSGLTTPIATIESAQAIHKNFYDQLPEALLWVENPETGERRRIDPGALRTGSVQVGRHIPIHADDIPAFARRFDSVYPTLGLSTCLLSLAAIHHRFVWIHPFLDGNGRVARLMSQALLDQHLQTKGLWSLARGLARKQDTYKELLANCDLPRRNDLDGRGALSEEALVELTRFFLEVSLDQVQFMRELIQPDTLATRINMWTEEQIRLKKIPARCEVIMSHLAIRGELTRDEVTKLVEMSERSTRRLTSALQEADIITSDNRQSPLRLVFSAKNAERWLPALFPAK